MKVFNVCEPLQGTCEGALRQNKKDQYEIRISHMKYIRAATHCQVTGCLVCMRYW